jgi:hypothetical protein
MALKRNLSEHERYGLTDEEIRLAEKYLRMHKTKGAVPDPQSMSLYELMMLGYSFLDISKQYPQYPIEQIILTAALKGWMHDREKMMGSLKDRVQTKVIKSVLEQVDILTNMISVLNTEHIEEMRNYILDPANNPKPSFRITSIKDYKDITDTLQKIVAGATSGSGAGKSSPMMQALVPAPAENRSYASKKLVGKKANDHIHALLEAEINDDEFE